MSLSHLDIPRALNIDRGSTIYLSSRVVELASSVMAQGHCFNIDELIDAFLEELGDEGTLLVPTFCFDFSDKGRYDKRKPKCFTGSLGKAALKRSDFKRTQHPMHSFAVAGKHQLDYCALENKESFGPDSPFALMMKHGAVNIMLGTDCEHAFTFAHYVEACAHVPYRFLKTFVGSYIDDNGVSAERAYDYFARKYELDPVEHLDRIGKVLQNKGILEHVELGHCVANVVDLRASYPVILDDIVSNQCRNLYDFACSRESVFDTWSYDA